MPPAPAAAAPAHDWPAEEPSPSRRPGRSVPACGAATPAAAAPIHALSRTTPGGQAGRRLAALNAELLRHHSATAALERWCRAHGASSAAGARAGVVAFLVCRADGAPADRRLRLGVGRAVPVRHRRVRLRCGGRVLSEAENWYVPGRLTPAMNRLLEETDTPFGRAVRDLRFRRRLLAAELLWSPAADGQGAHHPPPYVLRHHAVLLGPDGRPISEVVETYTRDALFLPQARA